MGNEGRGEVGGTESRRTPHSLTRAVIIRSSLSLFPLSRIEGGEKRKGNLNKGSVLFLYLSFSRQPGVVRPFFLSHGRRKGQNQNKGFGKEREM